MPVTGLLISELGLSPPSKPWADASVGDISDALRLFFEPAPARRTSRERGASSLSVRRPEDPPDPIEEYEGDFGVDANPEGNLADLELSGWMLST